MSQIINLYKAEKKVFKLNFNFKQSAYCLGGFLVVIVVVSCVDLAQHFWVKKTYNTLGKEQQFKTEKLQAIAGKMPEEKTRNEIMDEVNLYEAQKKEKTEILNLLSEGESETNNKFSRYFEALAKKTVPGLWLTNFSIKGNGTALALSGMVSDPEFIPTLISALSEEPVFQGKTFGVFKVSKDEKTHNMIFDLETKRKEEP